MAKAKHRFSNDEQLAKQMNQQIPGYMNPKSLWFEEVNKHLPIKGGVSRDELARLIQQYAPSSLHGNSAYMQAWATPGQSTGQVEYHALPNSELKAKIKSAGSLASAWKPYDRVPYADGPIDEPPTTSVIDEEETPQKPNFDSIYEMIAAGTTDAAIEKALEGTGADVDAVKEATNHKTRGEWYPLVQEALHGIGHSKGMNGFAGKKSAPAVKKEEELGAAGIPRQPLPPIGGLPPDSGVLPKLGAAGMAAQSPVDNTAWLRDDPSIKVGGSDNPEYLKPYTPMGEFVPGAGQIHGLHSATSGDRRPASMFPGEPGGNPDDEKMSAASASLAQSKKGIVETATAELKRMTNEIGSGANISVDLDSLQRVLDAAFPDKKVDAGEYVADAKKKFASAEEARTPSSSRPAAIDSALGRMEAPEKPIPTKPESVKVAPGPNGYTVIAGGTALTMKGARTEQDAYEQAVTSTRMSVDALTGAYELDKKPATKKLLDANIAFLKALTGGSN